MKQPHFINCVQTIVERYHRSYDEECIQVYRPADLDTVKTVTAAFQKHYNYERPHQGRSCRNQPPRVAFRELPVLPRVPEEVDPDRWLEAVDGQCYMRRVGGDGRVNVDSSSYYVSSHLSKQLVTLRIDAPAREFVIEHEGREVKRVAIRGVGSGPMAYTKYVEHMQQEARSDAIRRAMSLRQRASGQLSLPLD